MIAGRLGLREWDSKLRKAALWTYWKGAYRDTGDALPGDEVMQRARDRLRS